MTVEMTSKEFVDAIRRYVMEASVTDTILNLKDPPGRQPEPELIQQSRWYLALGEADRAMVDRLLTSVAEATIFGFFCALDGARTIAAPRDYFELRHVHDAGVEY